MQLDFKKMGGLIPAIIQDSETMQVLMLGFMNEEAYQKTVSSKQVTFYSRSKQRLWTKGETSGNYLQVEKILPDCDSDTLLIFARPSGPVCHTGQDSCFGGTAQPSAQILFKLQHLIDDRKASPLKGSYTNELLDAGIGKVSQKVGEEGVEVVVAALSETDERLVSESADLLYHFLVLLRLRGLKLEQVLAELSDRNSALFKK